nr:plasminogen receptor (KT)-like isoform X1 [Hydra vulgaris]
MTCIGWKKLSFYRVKNCVITNMGALLAGQMKSTMDENFKKNQEFMLTTQELQLGRQMAMQQLLQQKMMAMQLARQREMFTWIASFSATVSLGLLAGFARTKKPSLIGPIIPLGFLTAYNYDMVYGNKMERIKKDAEYILEKDYNLVAMPKGPLTFEEVENFRNVK